MVRLRRSTTSRHAVQRAILIVAEGERNFLASEHGLGRSSLPPDGFGWQGTWVGDDPYDVFVSSSRGEGRHAGEIDSVLGDRGLKIFFDRRNLAAGLPWVRALEQAIGAAK